MPSWRSRKKRRRGQQQQVKAVKTMLHLHKANYLTVISSSEILVWQVNSGVLK